MLTVEEIHSMNAEELRTALQTMRSMANDENTDLTNAELLMDAIEARQNELRDQAENRRRLSERVAAGMEGRTIRSLSGLEGAENSQPLPGQDSVEYRRAYILNLMGRGSQMTQEQRAAFDRVNAPETRAAFVGTTENTAPVIPTTLLNDIWNLIEESHVILGDVSLYRTGTILEVLKHTAIKAGDAKKVGENEANDDEENEFVRVTLTGHDFTKHVDISYALATMSVDGFESYLVSEISDRLAAALADDIVENAIIAQIDAANKVTTKGTGKITFDEVAGLFGKIQRARALTLYGTRATIYNYLVGMVDNNGRPIFQPNAQVGAEGTLLGARLRIEDSVPDGVLLLGDPKRVVYNMVHDVILESDRDIKKHVITHSGYCRGEGALIDPWSFATLTIKTA